MEKEAYTFLGKNLLQLKPFTGINLFYKKQNSTIMLHTETDLTNATLNGTFILPPGSFTIMSGKESGLDLKIRPDLISNDTKLEIDPIQKTFKFSLKKCCPCSGAGFQVDFDSATSKPILTLFPRFTLRNVLTSGYILFNSFHAIPEYRLAFNIGRVTLRHAFLPIDRKIRFGCFYQLGNIGKLANISFGTAAAFQQPSVPADAYFFAKADIQKTITSLIVSKEDQTITSEVRLVTPFRDNFASALSVKAVGKDVSGALGLSYECPVHHNRFNITVNSQKQVSTLVQIPLFNRVIDNASLGLCAVIPQVDSTFLKDHKVNFGFLLSFE